MRLKSRLTQLDLAALRRVYRHFGPLLRPHRIRLVLSAASLLGGALLTLAQPWPLKVVFDYALATHQKSAAKGILAPLAGWDPMLLVAAAAGAVLAVAALRGLLNYSESILTKTVGHRLVAAIRLQLFSHVQRLPQSYHDYRETGDLMTRMTGDIGLLEDLLTGTLIELGSQVILIVGMFAIMFWLDWQLALITLAVTPFFLLAAFRFSMRLKKSARRQREVYGKIVASVQESFAGISQVKSFGQEKQREKLIGKSMDRDVKANLKTTKLAANYARLVEIITAVGTCLVLWMGAKKAIAGTISAGDLLVFLAYVRGVYRPVQNIARLSTRMAKATVRGEKIMEILELQPEVMDHPDAISASGISGEFHFDRVNFSYTGERPILRDFSCHIPAGRTTLIIGHTGAGKSTLAKLILRLYDPQSGRIVLDGEHLSRYSIRSLRKRITPLAQETFLFRTTLAENIAFGRKRATADEIAEAARMAGIDKFIAQLPQGYDTLVGEGGMTLSGGQRQCISFARAALRRSPVMIFDEPATGLDVHAEREAKKVLGRLRKGRTLIIITHRLHFLDLADWAILIRDGQMQEEGAPGELRQRGGAFFEFVSRQREIPEADPNAGREAIKEAEFE